MAVPAEGADVEWRPFQCTVGYGCCTAVHSEVISSNVSPQMLQDFTAVQSLIMRDEFKVHEKRNHIVHHVLIMLLT